MANPDRYFVALSRRSFADQMIAKKVLKRLYAKSQSATPKPKPTESDG